MKDQKQVKIIGWKTNKQFGILQACEMTFSTENNLISVLGEVGSGKSTLQRAISIGSQGSEALRADKELYGNVDQETQLLDGDQNIFIRTKSNSEGSLDSTIYMKTNDGKKIKDPQIDGKKITPAAYLKHLQTRLSWRSEEIYSENMNVQKKLLLEIYQSELEAKGVVFDTEDSEYTDSILGKIDLSVSERQFADMKRKEVGGFAKHLLSKHNIDVYKHEQPVFIDLTLLEKEKNELEFELSNIKLVFNRNKKININEIQVKIDSHFFNIKTINQDIKTNNLQEKQKVNTFNDNITSGKKALTLLNNNLLLLGMESIVLDFPEEKKFISLDLVEDIKESFLCESPFHLLIEKEIKNIKSLKEEYDLEAGKTLKTNTEDLDNSINKKVEELLEGKESNKIYFACEAYYNWQALDIKVKELKNQYANLLESINTGVEGLEISSDDKNIFLTYNGCYDTEYFYNKNKEQRKISSYSDTQKPVICLLIQNFLLSKKRKAMRYLWIDRIPVDNKTKALLNKMGEDLDLIIFVNITGDFDENSLKNGEIFIQNGEVITNGQYNKINE